MSDNFCFSDVFRGGIYIWNIGLKLVKNVVFLIAKTISNH